VWEKASLFYKKNGVPQEPVSSKLKFMPGCIATGGIVRGTARGNKSASPVGRATLSLSPVRKVHFIPLLLSQALP